jgi:ion channel
VNKKLIAFLGIDRIERMLKNKYSHLLLCLVVIFIIAPFLDNFHIHFPFIHILFSLVIIMTIRALTPSKRLFITTFVLASIAIILEIFISFGIIPTTDRGVILTLLVSYDLFVGIALFYLIKRIFSEKTVNADTIKGGISIYLLFGFWWALLYSLVEVIQPGSFVANVAGKHAIDFYHFSFTTLTTVGYGDVIPKGDLATMLSSMEAIVGQVYLTVFVARLVGLHIVRSYNSKQS